MLRILTGFTQNIDDFPLARKDLHDQISLEKNGLKNKIGLFSCHTVAYTEGIVSELQNSYPFPTIGISSIYSGTDKGREGFGLSAMVLTSDDLTFGVQTIDVRNDGNAAERVSDAIAKLSADLRPSAFILIGETTHELSGEDLVQIIDAETGGDIPLFGLFACTAGAGTETPAMYYQGGEYKNVIALVAIYGELITDFHNISTAATLSHSLHGVVTKSEGNIVSEIDSMPACDFFKAKRIDPEMLITAPFIVTYPNGFTVTRCILPAENYDSGVTFFGSIPVGTKLEFGVPHRDDVYNSAQQIVNELTAEGASGAIIASCVYRSWLVAGFEDTEEDIYRKVFGEANVPYWFTYSYGELSPVYYNGDEGNFFHNYSVTIMTLR